MEPKEVPSFTIHPATWNFSDSPEGTDTGTTVCCQNWAANNSHPLDNIQLLFALWLEKFDFP